VSDLSTRLREINEALRALIDNGAMPLDSLNTSILSEGHGQKVLVEGGPSGLIYFASQCLDTVARNVPGAHAHVDEHSGADAGSIPMIVSLKLED